MKTQFGVGLQRLQGLPSILRETTTEVARHAWLGLRTSLTSVGMTTHWAANHAFVLSHQGLLRAQRGFDGVRTLGQLAFAPPRSDRRAWIGVDLDGTLAHYDRWRGIAHIGEPIQPMLERVKTWLDSGVEVRIFTARVSRPSHRRIATRAIGDWCEKHGLPRLPVTNAKDFGMIELWDDRAVRVDTNSGRCARARVNGVMPQKMSLAVHARGWRGADADPKDDWPKTARPLYVARQRRVYKPAVGRPRIPFHS